MKTWFLFLLTFIPLCSSLSLTAENGKLLLESQDFALKGVNYYGFEVPGLYAVQGLDVASLDNLVGFLANNSFNFVRLPWIPAILSNSTVPGYGINFGLNPDLQGLNSLQLLDKLIETLGNAGILVMLDMHHLDASQINATPQLWYDNTYSLSDMINFWKTMVTHYANTWNVVAVDLFNEPEPTTWASWAPVAEQIGNAILEANPNLLIFVEGSNICNATTNDQSFYGECFREIADYKINLSVPNKLVYSPHVYGPSVYMQPYFSASNFPANMPAIWDQNFGFVQKNGLGTIVIGEWGGYDTIQIDITWLNAISQYFTNNGLMASFFWDYSDNSIGTSGIVYSDWTTPDTFKLNLLATVQPNPTVVTGQGAVTVSAAPVDISLAPTVSSPLLMTSPIPSSPTSDNNSCSCTCNNGNTCSGVPAVSPAPSSGAVVPLYNQCGGSGGSCSSQCVNGPWAGYSCVSGSTCNEINQYYYQCQPSK